MIGDQKKRSGFLGPSRKKMANRTARKAASSALGHGMLAIAAMSMLILSFAYNADASPAMGRFSSPMLRLRGGSSAPKMTRTASQQDVANPSVSRPGPGTKDARKEKIWQLTKAYKPVDKESIQR